MIALFFGVGSWWATSSHNQLKPQEQVLTSSIVYDTIYVASKPDTVFTEKVVYRDQPVILTRIDVVEKNKPMDKNGINMKEKEELEKLLVSGSE